MSEELSSRRPKTALPSLGDPPPIKRTALLKKIASEKTPPVDNYMDIRGYVTLYKEKHEKELVLNKHEKAEEVHQMMETFSRNAQRSLFDRRCKTTMTNLRTKLETTDNEETDFTEESLERLKSFETQCQKRWDKMKARHEQELEKHYSIRPDDTPAKFRRRSPELLTMMRQERRLFFQSRFEEAAALRHECDIRDKEEEEAQNSRAMKHWNTVLKQMKDRHAKEEEIMRQWIQTRHEEYDQDEQVQVEAMRKRKKILGTDLKGTSRIKKTASPHFIRRKIMFERSKPRGQIASTTPLEELEKLSSTLPPRSKEILLKL